MRFRKSENLLWALPFGVLMAFFVLSRIRLPPREDALDQLPREKAGASALDCGRVMVVADYGQKDACALAAYKAHKAFRLRFDGDPDRGIARALDGTFWFMYFWPGTWRERSHMTLEGPVSTPRVVIENGRTHIVGPRDLTIG